jgi:hypothetical protein
LPDGSLIGIAHAGPHANITSNPRNKHNTIYRRSVVAIDLLLDYVIYTAHSDYLCPKMLNGARKKLSNLVLNFETTSSLKYI